MGRQGIFWLIGPDLPWYGYMTASLYSQKQQDGLFNLNSYIHKYLWIMLSICQQEFCLRFAQTRPQLYLSGYTSLRCIQAVASRLSFMSSVCQDGEDSRRYGCKTRHGSFRNGSCEKIVLEGFLVLSVGAQSQVWSELVKYLSLFSPWFVFPCRKLNQGKTHL